jgi:hypothetical protein
MASEEQLKADLLERLQIDSPTVVEEVLKLSLRQLEAEERRYAMLIGKAQSIVGQASVAVGLVSSLIGGVLLRDRQELHAAAPTLTPYIAGSVILALVLGVVAVLVAAFAQRVGETRELSMDDILSREELNAAHEARDGGCRPDPNALQRYRRFVIAHIWLVREQLVTRHHRIATQVQCAQGLFWGFVLVIGFSGVLMASAAIGQDGPPKAAPLTSAPVSQVAAVSGSDAATTASEPAAGIDGGDAGGP